MHVNNLVSDKLPTNRGVINRGVINRGVINRGVRRGNPSSPAIFTAVIEEIFKKAGVSKGVKADGEQLTNLRSADNIAPFHEQKKN